MKHKSVTEQHHAVVKIPYKLWEEPPVSSHFLTCKLRIGQYVIHE